MTTTKLTPFYHRSSNANIHYYGERGPERDGRVWVSVLVSAICRVDGKLQVKRTPDYYGTVYRTGEGEIARWKYTPKRKPNPQLLSPRVVARLTREALGVVA